MNIASYGYPCNHRIEFAQRYCKNAELHGVLMGFFDGDRKRFSNAWTARNADCSQETLRNLERMAETRLTAHAESTAQLKQLRQAAAQAQRQEATAPPRVQRSGSAELSRTIRVAKPSSASAATEAATRAGAQAEAQADGGAAAPREDEARDKIYPVWISNGRNVVGIGAPIRDIYPVMAFPRLGHSDVLEKQPLLRIGMAYVSQQLAETIDCQGEWPLAALETVISLMALRVLVVNQAGQIIYHQRRSDAANSGADGLMTGEPLVLPNKREHLSLREAVTQAIETGARSPLLPVSSLGGDGQKMAMVAPLQRPDSRMAIVIIGQHQVEHDLQYEHFFDSYEMTPSERLVAREVLRGRQLNDISASTGLSLSTIRSYLKQIFAKTRTHRQIDLVLLYYQVFPDTLGK